MSIRNLDRVLAPRSVAVIGASAREKSVGAVVLANMRAAGFAGKLMPVNPHETEINGLPVWPDIASLPEAPDLAVIVTPPDTVPGLVAALAKRGTAGAVVITAGFGEGGAAIGAQRRQAMLNAARPALLRIIGPNCLGLVVPGTGVNASFSHVQARDGGIACFTQSGAVAAALLDWAAPRDTGKGETGSGGIGFRYLVSMGDTADVDFGDLLDMAATDPAVHAVLLYVESIAHARKFMSAARAAARVKPVIVIKAGRHQEAAAAAASHTGALAGSDAVYDTAFRRAGLLRVSGLEQLFSAAETLSRTRAHTGNRAAAGGERVMILTNGGGFGVLATDALLDAGGSLAALSEPTRAALDKVLPATWSRANPIDIIGDAGAARYQAALDVLLADPGTDIVLALNCPTGVASPGEAADGVIRAWQAARGNNAPNLLACWLSAAEGEQARARLGAAGIAAFDGIADAIAGCAQLAEFARNQRAMLRVPNAAETPCVDRDAAGAILQAASAAGQEWLDADAARAVLAAYCIPTGRMRAVPDEEAAGAAAAEFGGKVALKIRSPQVVHKSDAGGVALDLQGQAEVRAEAAAMRARITAAVPGAVIDGFAVEEMIHRPQAEELIIGASVDPTFGPVILFGAGGVRVEAMADTALALPPLDTELASNLIDRTRVARLLRGYRNRPPADRPALAAVLVAVAQLVLDHPAIRELDINPLLADADGVIAVDVRIRLGNPANRPQSAIAPYPYQLESAASLPDGTVVSLRPIRPDDAAALLRLHARLSPADIRARFHGALRELDPALLARLTQIDYDREMALIGHTPGDDAPLGVARLHADPDNIQAEFAVVVRSDWHGRGLGTALMQRIIAIARARHLQRVVGSVLHDNTAMMTLAHELGFTVTAMEHDVVTITLDLAEPAGA